MNDVITPLQEFLFGGMQYQLEHHLFPIMPRYRYRSLAPIVRKWAKEQGLPYKVCCCIIIVAWLTRGRRTDCSPCTPNTTPISSVMPLPPLASDVCDGFQCPRRKVKFLPNKIPIRTFSCSPCRPSARRQCRWVAHVVSVVQDKSEMDVGLRDHLNLRLIITPQQQLLQASGEAKKAAVQRRVDQLCTLCMSIHPCNRCSDHTCL